MNKTLMNLLIKFLFTFALTWLSFGFIISNPILWIVIVALVITIINYLVGDKIVLPIFGNIIASIEDGLMAALIAFLMSLLLPKASMSIIPLAFYALTIAIAEYFFHKYLESKEKCK